MGLLAIPVGTGFGRENSGHAHPTLGWVGISERFLEGDDISIATALAYHERMHLQVGSEIRQMILDKHCDIDDFLKNVIMPDWMAGKINLAVNEDYLRRKGWDSLYDDWTGLGLDLEKAISAVDRYFTLLKKGLIKERNGRISHPSPSFSDDWQESMSKPDIFLKELYAANPQSFATILMTGYELAKDFEDRYRHELSLQNKASLWEMEEGISNYVSTGLSGIPLNVINAYAPQDAGHIQLAQKIIAADTGGAQLAVRDVKSRKDLISFLRRIGILRMA